MKPAAEQSPNEYIYSDLAFQVRIDYYEAQMEGLRKEAARGNLLAKRDLAAWEQSRSIHNSILSNLRNKNGADSGFDMSRDYRNFVREAIDAGLPVHWKAVEEYGEEIPLDYRREGELYCRA